MMSLHKKIKVKILAFRRIFFIKYFEIGEVVMYYIDNNTTISITIVVMYYQILLITISYKKITIKVRVDNNKSYKSYCYISADFEFCFSCLVSIRISVTSQRT